MALRINLYHEILRTKKQAQYDPLKLSMMGIVLVLVCLAGWFVLELNSKNGANEVFENKKNDLAQLEPKEKKAKADEAEFAKRIAVGQTLRRRIEERFYWAPVLEDLAATVPANVQTTKFSGDVTGDSLRKIQITLEGIAAGEEPRAVAEEFRMALLERLGKRYKGASAIFRTLDDNTDPASINGKSLKTAAFSIAVNFNWGTEPPPPPPPPRAARPRKAAAPAAGE